MFKRLAILALAIGVLAAPFGAKKADALDIQPARVPSGVFTRNAATGGKVIISWGIPNDSDLVAFKIYRSTASGCFGDLIATVSAKTNSYQDSGLADGTTYYYCVASLDYANNEGYSEQVSSIPSSNSVALYPDKTLLRFEGRSTVYKADSDGRTLKPVSKKVFDANGYSFSTVLVIPIEWQDSYKYGSADTFRNGTLIKGAGEKTVYIIDEGKKRPFASAAIFEGLGYKFSSVNEIPVSDFGRAESIDSYQTGLPVNATGSHVNGALIRASGDGTVYAIEGGRTRAISSLSIFYSHNFSFDDVVEVSVAELYSYSSGAILKFRDGSLIKGNSDTVYVINNDSANRVPFRSSVEFTGMGYSFSNVFSTSDADLTGYNLAAPFPV